MASNGTTTVCYAPQSGDPNVRDSTAGSSSKKRKSGIGRVFRKLFGRKNVKSQISAPTPTRPERVPNGFTDTTLDDRYKKAVSLPVGEISRHSALGSHAPTEIIDFEKDIQEQAAEERQPRTRRRASLPSFIGPTPDSVVDSGYHEHRQSHVDGSQVIDPSDIGFAVTSGSNPKRRSRSAEAFAAVRESGAASPSHLRTSRRRSDEIKYWRRSVGAVSPLESKEEDKEDVIEHDRLLPVGEKLELTGDTVPVSYLEDDDDDDEEGLDEFEKPEQTNRGTFDFGILASTIQEEENISVEERMVTVEIKLMDLEYAISKLQANAPIPAPTPSATNAPTLERKFSSQCVSDAPGQAAQGRQSPSLTHKYHVGSGSTTSASVSTQPTAFSLASCPPNLQNDDPFIDKQTRPTSNATTIRYQPISPIPSERNFPSSEPRIRSSIPGLTIDHFTTLISLIRTEQAARRQLQSQIEELQREIAALKLHQQQQALPPTSQPMQYPSRHSPASTGSFSRPRAWTSDHREGIFRGYGGTAKRMPSYDDTTSTDDDGYQDVYETPTEQRRIEYEGGAFNGIEGAAF